MKEEGRRKKEEGGFEMGIQTRHVCGESFLFKAAVPTQNERPCSCWGINKNSEDN
jgi:hypothetical protein